MMKYLLLISVAIPLSGSGNARPALSSKSILIVDPTYSVAGRFLKTALDGCLEKDAVTRICALNRLMNYPKSVFPVMRWAD
jgi:hypothetical protein